MSVPRPAFLSLLKVAVWLHGMTCCSVRAPFSPGEYVVTHHDKGHAISVSVYFYWPLAVLVSEASCP